LRISEGADGDRDHVLLTFEHVIHGGTAISAEMKGRALAGVSHAHEGLRLAIDGYALLREASLRTEDATCSTLAGKAMTDRDSNGVVSSHRSELPAAA
jgi:hypothetical protein